MYQVTVNVEVHACSECGAPIALLPNHSSALRASRRTFYCPNGHGQAFFGGTPKEREANAKAQEQERLRFEAEQRLARVEEERTRIQRELVEARRTTRKALTVGAHAVKKTRSAHARHVKQKRRGQP